MPEQQPAITPLTTSEAASDAITFATESFSKRRLRNVTKMTGMLVANVASDTYGMLASISQEKHIICYYILQY